MYIDLSKFQICTEIKRAFKITVKNTGFKGFYERLLHQYSQITRQMWRIVSFQQL